MEWSECVGAFDSREPVIFVDLMGRRHEYDMIIELKKRRFLDKGTTEYRCTLLDKSHHSETIVRPDQIELKKKD